MENTLNARFDIQINGTYQHQSSQLLQFPRRFRNETGIQQDSRGNDRRPVKTEIRQWESWIVNDPEVQTEGGLLFYLNAGVNTITIQAALGGTAIRELAVVNEEPAPDYEAYRQENDAKPDNAPAGYYWVRQAEDTGDTSDSVLYPTYDRSSAATQPSDPAKLRLNTIGQSNWNRIRPVDRMGDRGARDGIMKSVCGCGKVSCAAFSPPAGSPSSRMVRSKRCSESWTMCSSPIASIGM